MKHPDTTIRQLLQSQLWAARKQGLIHQEYTANPAMLASLALDAMSGNVDLAIRTLTTSILHLQQVQKEGK